MSRRPYPAPVRRTPFALGIVILTVALAACATHAERFASRAARAGFERRLVPGAGFDHVVFVAARPLSPRLHVYLDGDGVPWEAGQPAADPTPRRPLVLELMTRDPAAAVYVGRPCYHGMATAPGCRPALWNEARYSDPVVDSLVAVVSRLLDGQHHADAVLIGYSGGGALAMLMAPRIPRVAAVVTVAANLDTDGWAAYQRLPPLRGSRNPSRAPGLPASIVQLHSVGADDRAVPPRVVASGSVPSDAVRRLEGYDHICCWVDRWPAILAEADRALNR